METRVSHPEVQKYLERVEALFRVASEWARKIDPVAQMTRRQIDIMEVNADEIQEDYPLPEPISYQAESLIITRPASHEVRLVPQGRWVFGAEGLVAMESSLDSETLACIPEDSLEGYVLDKKDNSRSAQEPPGLAEWYWLSRHEYWKIHPFDSEVFSTLLKRLSR